MDLPVRKSKCATCPFRDGSEYAVLAPMLAGASMVEGRVCHSTGTNALKGRTSIKPHLCRGSRDIQLRLMATLGVIQEPTDEAWNEARCQFGMKPIAVVDPDSKKDCVPD